MTKKISKIKTMTDLDHCDCKWPIGDPRHADFHFCGAQQLLGRPYCQEHWNMSFVPGKARPQASLPSFPTRRAA